MSLKISLVLTAAFFLGALPAYAQTTAQTVPVSSETYATVNIQNATLTSQKGATFTIAFDLSNREGVQPGVRYGVSLVTINKGAVSLFDERVYDDTLTLGVNETVRKTVTYSAPENLSGTYSLLLSSKSSSGIPFGTAVVSTVTLQGRKDIVSIDPTSCFVTLSGDKAGTRYTLNQKASIDPSQTLFARCTVTNGTKGEVTLAPQVVQRLRSAYGDVLPSGKATTENVIVPPQTKKEFTLEIPKVTTPQTYYVQIALRDSRTAQETNTVAFRYTLQGAGASIRTLLLDKDAYSKGETATISFIWSPLVDTVSSKGVYETSVPLSSAIATFSIVNGAGQACGAPATYALTPEDRLVAVRVPITAECRNPKVSADIKDAVNGTLDAQSFSVVSRTANPSPLNSYFVIAGIIGLMLSLILLYKRRSISAPVILLLLAFSFVGGAEKAHADSQVLWYNCVTGQPCPGATNIFITGGIDQASYTLGQSVIFQVWMASDDNPQYTSGVIPYARGGINGNAYVNVFSGSYSPQELRVGIFGQISIGSAPAASGYVGTAYGSAGYGGKAGSIPLTVVAPPATPTVQINFQ